MQIFHRSTNTIAKVSIFGAVFFLAFFAWIFSTLMRSSYATRQGVVLKQPVPFSHDHHVAGLGIDCRYCHTSVEKSAFAGIPPTETCMNCHRQIWTNADMLEPVRASYRDNVPIEWTRVHDLPDFAYFNHSVHVAKGIGCVTCHGQVDRMPLMFQQASLQMEWCLECHKDPAKNVRPKEEVFNLNWDPADAASFRKYAEQHGLALPAEARSAEWTPSAEDVHALQAKLAKDYNVQSLMSCSTCHR
ncbi:MAG TPA: cytochrome c3 family protein [Thermoanaerobaculia bacterium]|nr:cytochrome c3 family protein [Thermoanaerobaculia bacterium]